MGKVILERFGSIFPSHFTFVMGTGILSVAALHLSHRVLGWVLLGFALFGYGVNWAGGLVRLVRQPREVWRDLLDHEAGPLFLTMVAGAAILCTAVSSFHLSHQFMLALFATAACLWGLLTYAFLSGVIEGRRKPSLERGLNGSWLLLVVATASCAQAGSRVLRSAGPLPALAFICYAWMLLAGLYYVVFASIIIYRFAFVPMPPGDLSESWWINESAAANTVLAGSMLVQAHNAPIGSLQINGLISPFLVAFWADASFWIPVLVVLFTWKHLVRRLPISYKSTHWTVVYALAVYAEANLQFRSSYDLQFLLPAARVTFWISLVGWGLALVGILVQAPKQLRRAGESPEPDLAPAQSNAGLGWSMLGLVALAMRALAPRKRA